MTATCPLQVHEQSQTTPSSLYKVHIVHQDSVLSEA